MSIKRKILWSVILVISWLATGVCGYWFCNDRYASSRILFDGDSNLQWGPYEIHMSRNIPGQSMEEKIGASLVVFSKLSRKTGNPETTVTIAPDGEVNYNGRGLFANGCSSNFDLQTGQFLSGSYTHYTSDARLKCVYLDKDADGLWDTWMVCDDSEVSSTAMRHYKRDGLSWVEIFPQNQTQEDINEIPQPHE